MSREQNQNQNLVSLINSGGLFFIEGTKVHVIPLYRGDGRVPEVILPEGFACRGTNPNLQTHVNDGARQSIYISTSQSQAVATSFAEKNCHGTKSFVYEINPQKTGIDVLKSLKHDIKAGRTCDYVTEHALAEKEVAVPHKIAGKDIKGVWVLEGNAQTGSITKTFVKNPAYVAPLAKTTGVLGAAGKTMTGVAAAMDAVNLSYAFFDSVEAGNYERFFNEGARIAGGWSAAVAAGATCGQMGALWLAPLGPVASLAGGIVCGAIGSMLAYHAGGALAQNAETMISRMLREEKWVVNQFQTELKSGHNTMMKKLYVAENQRTLSVKPDDFYRTVYVPLPSKIPVFLESDSEAIVCKKLDGYFADLIRGYPVSIKKHLRAMYYRNLHVISEHGYTIREKAGARVKTGDGNFFKASLSPWHEMVAEYQYNPQKYHPMIMDAEILCCPVLSRFYKMHEIAGHVGQMLQWEQQIGHSYFMGDQREIEPFKQFLEQSVTILEKLLIDALPVSIIERDMMMHMQSTAALKDKLLLDTIEKKSISLIDYVVHLERHRYQCDENYTRLFLNRPDIQDFLTKHTEALSNSQANRAPLANTQSQRSILPAHALMIEQKQKELAAKKNEEEFFMRPQNQLAEAKLPRFNNLSNEGPRDTARRSLATLKATLQRGQTQEYLYVISESGEVRITESTKNGKLNFHTDLVNSKDEKVLAAGEIMIENGRCVINNKSGNYKSTGSHLKDYVLSKILPSFSGKENCVIFSYENYPLSKETKPILPTYLEAAEAASRELECKIATKKAELVKATLERQQAHQRAAEAEAVLKREREKETALANAAQTAYSRFLESTKALTQAARIAHDSRIKADNALKAAGLLTADGILKTKLMPTQLTSSSPLSDAFIAIRNVRNSAELKKNENFLEHSKQMNAFQDYLFSKIGRRLPLLPYIIEAHPTVSTADEFCALAQQYRNGDKATNHYSLDCLHMVDALNPNHHNALFLIGAIYFSGAFGTGQNQAVGVEYLKRAREKGNPAAAAILSAIPPYVSSTPDNDGEGQMAAVRQASENSRLANRILHAINNGQFDLRDQNYSHAARDLSQSNGNHDHHNSHGEHAGNWGARGGSDMWGGGSRGAASGARAGAYDRCPYNGSNASGDLYKCHDGRNVHLGGHQGDHTRTATICRDDACLTTVFTEAARSNGRISYDARDLGVRDAMITRDFSYDRDPGGHNGFDTGNSRGDAVDRAMASR